MINTHYLKTARTEMIPYVINNPTQSLEVGCREGLFSKELKKIYPNLIAWGIEPDDRVDHEESIKNLDYYVRDFFPSKDKAFEGKKFDLIIFNDVLEHMYDPWKALEVCSEILSPNGIIVASLPNVRHKSVLKQLVFNDDFEYQESGVLDISHIRFFTKKTMIKLFEDCGFEIVKIEPLKSPLKLYKKILRSYKQLFHLITFNKFSSIRYAQYAIVAKVK